MNIDSIPMCQSPTQLNDQISENIVRGSSDKNLNGFTRTQDVDLAKYAGYLYPCTQKQVLYLIASIFCSGGVYEKYTIFLT